MSQSQKRFLSFGDKVVNQLEDLIGVPETVTALRAGLIFRGLLRSFGADKLHCLFAKAQQEPPPAFALIKQPLTTAARRGISAAVGLLGAASSKLLRPSVADKKHQDRGEEK